MHDACAVVPSLVARQLARYYSTSIDPITRSYVLGFSPMSI